MLKVSPVMKCNDGCCQFAVMLFLIFMAEVAGGVAGYLMQKDIDAILKSRMDNLMQDYNKNAEITNSWNALQFDVSNSALVFRL